MAELLAMKRSSSGRFRTFLYRCPTMAADITVSPGKPFKRATCVLNTPTCQPIKLHRTLLATYIHPRWFVITGLHPLCTNFVTNAFRTALAREARNCTRAATSLKKRCSEETMTLDPTALRTLFQVRLHYFNEPRVKNTLHIDSLKS